jgi:hypothetical protein
MKTDANGVWQWAPTRVQSRLRWRFDEWKLWPVLVVTRYTRPHGPSRPHWNITILWLFAISETVIET